MQMTNLNSNLPRLLFRVLINYPSCYIIDPFHQPKNVIFFWTRHALSDFRDVNDWTKNTDSFEIFHLLLILRSGYFSLVILFDQFPFSFPFRNFYIRKVPPDYLVLICYMKFEFGKASKSITSSLKSVKSFVYPLNLI